MAWTHIGRTKKGVFKKHIPYELATYANSPAGSIPAASTILI
jgi:hypothetical protein